MRGNAAVIVKKGTDPKHRSNRFRKGSVVMLEWLCLVFLGSCLTHIEDYSGYDNRGQVVISGQISSLEEANTISIARTAERLPRPVSGALVSLLDDSGNVSYYTEDPERKGTYVLENGAGTPGTTYHIRVTMPEGEVYESIPEKIPEALAQDSVYYAIDREEYTDQDGIVAERYFLKIFTDTRLPSSVDPMFIKWHVEEVYILSPTDFPDPFNNVPPSCYISQQVDPQRITLFNGDEVKTAIISNQLIISRLLDRTFKERHYFNTYQSVITREAYEYWRKVDILANQVGSIFDPPPARVRGNLFNVNDKTEDVHGYFQAVNQIFHRFFMLPQDLPYLMPAHCEYSNDRDFYDYPSECLDCLSVRNSSHKRPDWF